MCILLKQFVRFCGLNVVDFSQMVMIKNLQNYSCNQYSTISESINLDTLPQQHLKRSKVDRIYEFHLFIFNVNTPLPFIRN